MDYHLCKKEQERPWKIEGKYELTTSEWKTSEESINKSKSRLNRNKKQESVTTNGNQNQDKN
jgi:predicted acyltransferase (DUF342 family)